MKKHLLALGACCALPLWLLCQPVNLQLYEVPGFDISPAKIFAVSDGGYLMAANLNCRNAIGCTRRNWLTRIDLNGDTLWTKQYTELLPYLSEVQIFENEDHTFTVIGNTNGNDACYWLISPVPIDYFFLSRTAVLHIDGTTGNLLSHEFYTNECSFSISSAVKTATGSILAVGYYDEPVYSNGPPPTPRWLHISPDGTIIEAEIANTNIETGKLLPYDTGTLFLLGKTAAGQYTLSRLNPQGQVQATYSIYQLSNTFSIKQFKKTTTGTLVALLASENNAESRLLEISTMGQVLKELILPYYANDLLESAGKYLMISTITVGGQKDIRITPIGIDGKIYPPTLLDWGSSIDNPVQIISDGQGEVTIAGTYRVDVPGAWGYNKLGLSRFNQEATIHTNYAAEASVTTSNENGTVQGKINLEITEQATCTGSYNIVISRYPSGVASAVTYLDYAAGSYTFPGFVPGQYQITVQEAGDCGASTAPIAFIVNVPTTTNNTAPVLYLLDFMGQPVGDTDPSSTLPDNIVYPALNIGDNNCSYQETYYAYALDSEGNVLISEESFHVSNSITWVAPIDISSYFQNGLLEINIEWPTGTNKLTISYRDEDDNIASIELQRKINGFVPEITIDIPDTLYMPICSDEVISKLRIYIDDPCYSFISSFIGIGTDGQYNYSFGPDSEGFYYREFDFFAIYPPPYTYQLDVVYWNFGGVISQKTKFVHVVQATEDFTPVVSSTIDTIYTSGCQPGIIDYKFTVCDDCTPIDIAAVHFDGGDSGLPTLNGSELLWNYIPNTLCKVFQITDTIVPGSHNFEITYQGVSHSLPITVITIPEPIEVYPQNMITGTHDQLFSENPLRFTVPICDTCGLFQFRAYFYYPCDSLNISNVFLRLPQGIIYPAYSNNHHAEFTLPLCLADNGLPIQAGYTTPSGQEFIVETTLEITNNGGDLLPPVIHMSQGPIPLTINNCGSNAVNYWYSPDISENCAFQTILQGVSAPDFLVLPVSSNLYLVKASTVGTFDAQLEVVDPGDNLVERTLSFEVSEEGDGTAICADIITLPVGPEGWSLLTAATALGNSATCLSAEDYYIKVSDANPANGNQVDGCGEYPFEVYAAQTLSTQGFNGIFASDHWAVRLHPSASVTFTDALQLDISAPKAYGALAITFPEDGLLTFDYAFQGTDFNVAEKQLRLIDAIGNTVNTWGAANTGHVQQSITAGQTLILYAINDLSIGLSEKVVLSNWVFEPSSPNNNPFCTGLIQAYDDLAPVALTQVPPIELNDNGLAQLTVGEIDSGSYDNCGLASRKIRRLYSYNPTTCEPLPAPSYSDWADFVDFTCCDACKMIPVELRLRDETGNETIVVVEISPAENHAPQIFASEIDPICCINPSECFAAVQHAFTILDDCKNGLVVGAFFDQNQGGPYINLSGVLHQLPDNKYKVGPWTAPIGQHALIIRVRDACNNYSDRTIPFQVADCTDGYPPIIMLGEDNHGSEEQFITKRNPPLLEQNTPNPFREETQVRFWLPEAGAAVFSIVDINGRVVFQAKNTYDQGWNALTLQAADLPARGLYFYQLEAAGQRLWRKLVRL